MTTTRRRFLAGAAAALAVGFNPLTRRWVSVANAASPCQAVPPLDGTLLTDPESLAAVAVDVGNIVHDTPVAVLEPGSVEDIRKMILFCRRFGIPVAARGQGHTTFGQAQVLGGLVIRMEALGTIHAIGPDYADVDAGVTWKTLAETAFPLGLTPPVLTGFTGLSIAGTLSVGGISRTYGRGAQVDHVRELEVVTGAGDVVRCSLEQNRDLFEVALGGLGQCAIITRAVVDLIPARPMTHLIQVSYTDNAAFFADYRTILDRGEVDDAFNIWQPDDGGGFVYQMNLATHFDPASPPDTAYLVRGLSAPPDAVQAFDLPYLAYELNVDALVDYWKAIGLWEGIQRPWFDVFLSNEEVESYVGEVLSTLTPEDVGATGFLLLFAQRRSQLTRPFLRMPDSSDWTFLFDILTSSAGPDQDPEFVQRMLDRNRSLFERARSVGGTRYPISAIPFHRGDWARHYGEMWPELIRRKHHYDPNQILTPGPGIF